ncbi:hypothetical protein HK101_008477 [Irineochytrium annulatum]|nr:hypothetical protein HK101_008477 [Irineochytrium annulatum]
MQQQQALFQCSLQGLIRPFAVPRLLERIVGVCGFIWFEGRSNLMEVEAVWEPEVKAGPGQSDAVLRLRCSVIDPKGGLLKSDDTKWTMLYLGPPEPLKPNMKAKTRVAIETGINGDAELYMEMLGYRLTTTHLRKGYRFHHGAITITVSLLYDLPYGHRKLSEATVMKFDDVEDEQGWWLVEVEGDGVAQEGVLRRAEEVSRFAGLMKGLVDLPIVV